MATDRPVAVIAPPRRTNWAGAIVALIIVAAVGGWAYVSTRPKPAKVEQRDIVGLIPLNGEVIAPPSARADVYSPYRAPVDKVETSVGSHVQRGDVLVKLSFPDIQAALDQARASVKAAETAYANAERQFNASIRSAQQSQPPVTNPPDTGNGPSGPIDQNSAPPAATTDTTAQMRAERDAALIPYKQQLDAAREAYQAAKSGAKAGQLRAPIPGTVMALNAAPGKEVGADPKIPVATIVNLDELEVQAALTPEQAGVAKPGTPVEITLNELPGKQLQGKIARVTTQVVSKLAGLKKDTQFVALIDFKNDNGAIKPGMKPNVAIKTGEVKNALAVPAEAVGSDSSGKPTVKVLRNGDWRQVVVATGISDGRYTQIKQGVQAGETVQVVPNPLAAATRLTH